MTADKEQGCEGSGGLPSSRLGSLAGRSIAIFGSSEPGPDSPPYEEARRLGQGLARAGARVVCGGYGGVMEAASRGAREGGGEAVGVTGTFFTGRVPNRWLSRIVECGDLFERTRVLIELSDAFIILPGKSGTIAELAILWALHRARLVRGKPVILCGGIWPDLVGAIERAGALELEQREMITFCDTVDPVIDLLAQHLAH